jgi:spoIIIJ-associated protein
VSDRVFSGRDVAEALGLAASALGLPQDRLRYVVLDPGSEGGLGLRPTPARVAVLLTRAPVAAQHSPSGVPAARPAEVGAPAPAEGASEADVPAAVEALVTAMAETAKLDLRARATLTAEALLVELAGSDVASFLLGPGEPSVADALEHLLHGAFAHRVAPRRLRVECEGQREQREEKLRGKALALAAEVLRDGQPRTTDPLNAYERRLVHMAIDDQPGVITYSVGGGSDRRVTIAPEKVSLGGEVY